MDIKKEEILYQAIRSLETFLGTPGSVSAQDGRLLILGHKFAYTVRESVDKVTYNAAVAPLKAVMTETDLPGILVAGAIHPDIMTAAKADGVFTLDAAGSCEIAPEGGPFLSVRGRKK